MSKIEKDEQIFEYFGIRENYRNLGIGTCLLNYAECLAKDRGANVRFIKTNNKQRKNSISKHS